MTLVSSVQAEDSTINSHQTIENTSKTPPKTLKNSLKNFPNYFLFEIHLKVIWDMQLQKDLK